MKSIFKKGLTGVGTTEDKAGADIPGDSAFQLSYFDIFGRAEPIRMMLAVAHEPIKYEDVRIDAMQWANFKA